MSGQVCHRLLVGRSWTIRLLKSILVIRGGAIGDFILTLPAIHALRDKHPTARMEIMGYTHITKLAHERFYADAVRAMDHRSVAGFFAARSELDPELSSYFRSFEVVISYLYDPDHIFATNLERAGVKRLSATDGRPTQMIHAMEHLSKWLPDLDIPHQIQAPRLYHSLEDSAKADAFLASLHKPFVALHIGSGSTFKTWLVERYLELAEWLKSRNIHVLVLDGPADIETATPFWKDSRSKNCLRVHGQELPVVAAILQRCSVFVGNDSGISHMAAAVGTPTIAIFGTTDPRLWGPRGKSVVILQRGTAVAAVQVGHVKTALEPHLQKALNIPSIPPQP